MKKNLGKITALVTATVLVGVVLTACSPQAAKSGDSKAGLPDGTVKIVVPYAAGGTTDIAARALAVGLEESLDQTVIVENQPGAGAVAGTATVANSKADGLTILFSTDNAIARSTVLDTSYTYDSFTPVRGMFTQPYLLAVGADQPFESVDDVIDSGEVNYAVAGIGSVTHLDAAILFDENGVDATAVPFDGTAPAVQAVVGGNAPLTFIDSSGVLPYLKSGDLRALAAFSASGERIVDAPDVPTLEELGYSTDSLIVPLWGLSVPAGTPDGAVAALRKAADEAASNSDYISILKTAGMPPLEGDLVDNWFDVSRDASKSLPALFDKLGIKL